MRELLRNNSKKQLLSIVATLLPRSLAAELLRLLAVPGDLKVCELSKKARFRLADLLYMTPLHICGTLGFPKAMVTRGGVELKNIDPRSMQSRLVDKLYFAGEMLDLDGPCGGYNLQWAFSSGFLAGASAARR